MPLLLRCRPRLLLRPVQRCAYSSALAPAISVTNVPAPHSGSIRILSLNRPAARNAISRQLLTELHHQVNSIQSEGERGPTRALILASEVDASFCAGADLKERATFTQEDTANFLANLRGTFTALSQLPIPTISALAAPAFGGGLELALTTHMRIFASNTTVALPETRLAIIPGAGGTYRLPALIGLSRARDMILTGRRVGAPEAYFLGLCDRLVEVTPEEAAQEGAARKKVLGEAIKLASDICEGGPIALKAALAAVEGCALGEKAENAAYELVVRTKDRDEALAAFREKRKPVFRGE
ncbi:ClpP/crotonase-like domain-containing protein [Ampelomyces quisqualis]|uniref:ClpP/crotonase-like domain-containing protein n=1 Tax=Ampelomyces quisqualis TaxID=50730 RepID=A0A6A5R3C3_AMPQU|nr:ClpP/crotonase-like domain-containing protein [Ampelomyces quisqualis]